MDTAKTPARYSWWRLAGVLLAVILIPFALLASPLEAWGQALQAWRPEPWLAFILVVVLLGADIVLPIPSSIVLVFSGASLGWGLGALANGLGLTVSLLLGHALGTWAADGRLRRLVTETQRQELERAFARWGGPVLVATRLVPVLSEATAFLSGLARWPRAQVAFWGGLANVGVAGVMAAAGAVSAHYGQPAVAWAAALGVPLLAWGAWVILRRRVR